MTPSQFNQRPGTPLSRREASAAMLGLLGAGLASCGPVRSPRVRLGGNGKATFQVTSPRVDAVPGRMLVVPVRIEGPLPGSTVPRLATADGRDIEASLTWIGIETNQAAWSSWLPAIERWVVTPVTDGSIPASVGAWHVVAQMPAAAAGQAIRLGDKTIPVNWLAAPEDLNPAAASPTNDSVWAPWRAPETAPIPDADLLVPEWRSPIRRWRARLATNALGSRANATSAWQVDGDPRILDGLADLIEARWCAGLARLWYTDPDACQRLTARLVRTVELAPGVHAPAWPTDQPMLDSLLSDLLDPSNAGRALSTRSQAWVDSLPQAAAWVVDDAAGLVGPNSEPLVQLRAAGFDDQPLLLWVAGRDGLRVSEPHALQPGQLGEASVATGRGSPLTGASGFTVRCGRQTFTLAARQSVRIRPPGASCGPLLHDWTLSAWSASQPNAAAATGQDWAAGVLVYRDDSQGLRLSDPETRVDAWVWTAFVECATPEHDGPSEPILDEVSLWFGQRGAPAAVLHVSRDGTLRHDRHPEDGTRLRVADEGDRWSVSVPIPREAIEPGGVLRIGITRRDTRGLRTAWPRRMMPWEREPARAAINLNSWNGLG